TFLLQRSQNGTALKLIPSNTGKPAGPIRVLTPLGGGFFAADIALSKGGAGMGARLSESGASRGAPFTILKWTFEPGGTFKLGDAVPVAWPAGRKINDAILRVNANGTPFALLRADPKDKTWHYLDKQAKISPFAELDEIQPPLDILFRQGDD